MLRQPSSSLKTPTPDSFLDSILQFSGLEQVVMTVGSGTGNITDQTMDGIIMEC